MGKTKKSRKVATSAIALVVAVSLILSGTFAWQSISQRVLNESKGVVNVGGRLHDDFDGKNKDIYVENFTDPLNGGTPIYARVRLDEYMETGEDAGQNLDDPARKATSKIAGATIGNKDTWSTYIPDQDNPAKPATDPNYDPEKGDNTDIHEYWTWTLGMEEGETKYYMPTFNKNKDSLEADINGTYVGTDGLREEGEPYDDYVLYGIPGEETESDENAENAEKVVEKIENTDAVYDADEDDIDQYAQAEEMGLTEDDLRDFVTIVPETHEAKQTQSGTVISMTQWVAEGKEPGNYWVYDTDGWAYWANPIMPGEATGLLLSGIEMTENPGAKSYYAINVVAQFATAGDLGKEDNTGFYTGESPTPEAEDLLDTIVEAVPTITVTNTGNVTVAYVGDKVEFRAKLEKAGKEVTDAEITWIVLDSNGKALTDTTIGTNGLLTIAEDAYGQTITVIAQSAGAVGKKALYIGTQESITIIQEEGAEKVIPNREYTLNFSAEAALEDSSDTKKLEDGEVLWTLAITDQDGQPVTSDSTIDETTGQLTIADDLEEGMVLTITATSVLDNDAFDTYEILVQYNEASAVTVQPKATVMALAAEEEGAEAEEVINVVVGSQLAFEAIVTGSGADVDQRVTWKVSGGKEGTSISQDGVLTVGDDEAEGTVLTITATSRSNPDISGSCKVTVLSKVPNLVTITPKTADVIVGETLDFEAAVTKDNATEGINQNVDWTVTGGNDAGTSIDENGTLTVAEAETAKTLTITATSRRDSSVSGSATVNVLLKVPDKVEISEATDATTVTLGTELNFSAEVTLDGTDAYVDQNVNWTVSGKNSDGSDIKINSGTKIETDSDGKAVLKVPVEETATTLVVTVTSTRDTSVTDTYEVTVQKIAPTALTVTEKEGTKEALPETALIFEASATADGEDAAYVDQSVTWSIEGTKGVNSGTTIDEDGNLTISVNEHLDNVLTIKATSKSNPELSATYTVTVIDGQPAIPDNVKVTAAGNATTVIVGDTLQFSKTVTLGGNSANVDSNVTWSIVGVKHSGTTISDSGLLTVSSDETLGRVLVIRASSTRDASIYGEYQVTVTVQLKVPTAITVTATGGGMTTSIEAGGSVQLNAAATIDGSTAGVDQSVTWSVMRQASTDTTIDENGYLRVSPTESPHILYVTATSKRNNAVVSDLYVINVLARVPGSIKVTAEDNAATVVAGNTLQFSKTATLGGSSTNVNQSVTWTVTGKTAKHSETTISSSGLLTVNAAETVGNVLTVKATSTKDGNIYGEYKVTVLAQVPDTVTVTTTDDTTSLPGKTINFTASAALNGSTDCVDQDVTWRLSAKTAVKSGTSIDKSTGELTVDASETPGNILIIRATSTRDASVYGEYKIQLEFTDGSGESAANMILDAGTGEEAVVTIDGIEWYVVISLGDKALLWAKDPVPTWGGTETGTGSGLGVFDDTGNNWKTSTARIWLNGTFLDSLPTLRRMALTTDIKTKTEVGDDVDTYATTSDKVFLFTRADVEGSATSVNMYTYNEEMLPLTDAMKQSDTSVAGVTWLRAPRSNVNSVSILYGSDGSTGYARAFPDTDALGVRPALWVSTDASGDAVETAKDMIWDAGTGEEAVVTIDGIEWYVVVNAFDQALLWAKDPVPTWGGEETENGKGTGTFDDESNKWKTSTARIWLNGTFLNSLPTLRKIAQATDIKTRTSYTGTSYATTTDRVFLLTEADVFGTKNGSTTTAANEYTYNGEILPLTYAMKNTATSSWLRSPRNYTSSDTSSVALINSYGISDDISYSYACRVRPALWVRIR